MQVKCPVILTCPLGVVIVADELIWGQVMYDKRSCCRGKYLLGDSEGCAVGCL